MTIVTINELGKAGTIKDQVPYELPLNAWSDSVNCRVKDNAIRNAVGYQELNATPPVAPHYLQHFKEGGTAKLVYAGLNKIYFTHGGVHTNKTRQTTGVDVDYSAVAGGWTGGVLGGIPILNNGIDLPQSYTGAGDLFEDMPAFPSTTRCKVMRQFREFLVALDITKNVGTSDDRFPHLVKWSHPADPGTVPVSWDETDPSKDAGEYPLVSSGGELVDLMTLRDFAIIYKTDSLYMMQYIGAPFIFSIKRLNFGHGLLHPNCLGYVKNGHFVVSNEDILWHNGVEYQQLGPKRMNDWVFRNIDMINAHKAHVGVDVSEQKVWFCFPTGGADYANMALVWDWSSDTFMIQDVPQVSSLLYGESSDNPGGNLTWDDGTALQQSWDSGGSEPWGARSQRNLDWEFMGCSPDAGKIFSFSRGNTADGTPQLSYMERTGIPLAGQDKEGNPIIDLDSWKLFRAIWPKVRITSGHSITVRIGSQIVPDGAVTWAGPFQFNPQTDNKINCLVSGRFLCMRFETHEDVEWEITGYDVDVELLGRF